MPVVVDSREKAELRKYLFLKGIKFSTRALITGDYLFWNKDNPDIRVLIERKNIGDLVSSYVGGRIEAQFKRMAEEPFPILLVTGTVKDLSKSIPFKVHEDIAEKVISDAVIKYGFRSVIWIVNGFKDPRREGVLTAVNILKSLVDNNLDNIPAKKSIKKADPRLDALKGFLNVKVNIAISLLKKFGTVGKVLAATDQQLLAVDGVGISTVNRIRFIMDKNFNETIDESVCKKCKKAKSSMIIRNKQIYICIGCKKR